MSENKEKKQSAFKIVSGTLKYFFPIAWRFRKGYFFAQVLYTICGILQPFVPIIMTPLLIDGLMGKRDIDMLIRYAAVLVIGETVLSLSLSLLQMLLEKYDIRFQNYFSEEMSRRVMELDFQLTEDKNALDQIEKARTGMDWYSGGVHGIAMQFFGMITNVAKILGVAVLLVINAPVLLIVTAVLLVIGTVLNAKINKIEIESFNNLSKHNRIFGYLFYEMTHFKNGKDIRLYGAEDMMLEKSDAQAEAMIASWKLCADKQLPFSMGITFTDAARDSANYFYLGFLVITGKISIGVFSQMLTAGATFHNSVRGIINNIQEIIKRSNYAYEYVKFMDYPAAMDKGERKISGGREHTIEFRNVSFTYPNTDVKVLDDVSITLKAGEHLSVVGLNGAGKTTFIKLLCRLYDVDSGAILLDGVNIREYDYEEYMSLFSVVFQDFKLLAFTARENITLDDAADERTVNDIVKMAGLEEKIRSLPNGLDTVIFKQFDENGIEPSGGEQQKLAIARALYKNSPVVILDEPTAALDPVAEYEIYRQFNSLVGGKTAVYISHRLSSCKFCDRIAVFSGGTIKELGTHDELVAIDGGIYAEMFAAQAQYYN